MVPGTLSRLHKSHRMSHDINGNSRGTVEQSEISSSSFIWLSLRQNTKDINFIYCRILHYWTTYICKKKKEKGFTIESIIGQVTLSLNQLLI